jgi:WD40 repeat protein
MDESERTEEEEETYQVSESFFGIIGEYGNNLMVYDTESIILKHQIQAGHVLRSFEFNKNATEVIMVTDDLKIKFYSLSKFEGQFLRELATVHRGSINSVDLSLNGGFMLSGGDDNLIKVWDYEAQKTVPYYFQAFIGHTYPITDVMFNPCDNN